MQDKMKPRYWNVGEACEALAVTSKGLVVEGWLPCSLFINSYWLIITLRSSLKYLLFRF